MPDSFSKRARKCYAVIDLELHLAFGRLSSGRCSFSSRASFGIPRPSRSPFVTAKARGYSGGPVGRVELADSAKFR
jgi:hypothetical protein